MDLSVDGLVDLIKRLLKDKRVVAFLVVLAVAFAGYKGWIYWISRPEYSISNLKNAIVTKDVQSLERYVSLNDVYSNAVDEALAVLEETDVDEFTRTIALGLDAQKKGSTVSQLKNATLAAFGADVSASSVSHLGMFGNAVGIMCENIKAENPTIVFADIEILKKNEVDTDIRFVFYDTKGKKTLPVDARMYKQPDGHWQVRRLLNMRNAYQNAEFILDKSYEEARKADEAELLKRIEERKKEESKIVTLSEKDRLTASAKVRALLRKNANKVIRNNDSTIYRFASAVGSRNDVTFNLINDVVVMNGTNHIRNVTSLVLFGSERVVADFHKIYFSSSEKGMLVNVDTWEGKGLGMRLPVQRQNDTDLTYTFTATTDDFVDIYKIVFENTLNITFYGEKDKMIAAFKSNDKMRKSIMDFMKVKDMIKDNLFFDGRYVLLPVSDDDIRKAELDMAAEEKEQKEKEEKSKLEKNKSKDANEKGVDIKNVDKKDVGSKEDVKTTKEVKPATPEGKGVVVDTSDKAK